MDLLLFKLTLTPLLLLVATLAARRWGETIGGFLVGMPLTSAPISMFLALEHGPAFAARAAAGSLVASTAQAACCLVYCQLARRGWRVALAGTVAAFAATACVLAGLDLPPGVLLVLAVFAVTGALQAVRHVPVRGARLVAPWWDIPVRLVLIAALVVGVTHAAPYAGPAASGAMASFPFMAMILAIFAHRSAGAVAAQHVLRGMVAGLYSFTAFFFVLGTMLERAGLGASYTTATLSVLVVQALWLRYLRRIPRL